MSEYTVSDLYAKIQKEIAKVIIGKGEIEKMLVLSLLAEGHILIEGPPGTAKTKLAQTFAKIIGGEFKRIQFTADMIPADVTGFYLYSTTGTSRIIQGPIFGNIILADELNRTTPRTQSAMLEAMQERQVTIEGKTYPLAKPFLVIATQVQAGAEGTYALTNVQLDRFMLKASSGYSSKDEEKEVLTNIDLIDEPDIKVVTSLDEINNAQILAKKVQVSPDIIEYIVSIVDMLRTDPDTLSGPSIRAGIALYKCARVLALIDGRNFVIPDDIKELALPAIEHRVKVKSEAEMDGITPRAILDRVLEKIPVPKPSMG